MPTARKLGLLFGLSVLSAFAFLTLSPREAAARGRDQKAVAGTYRDEGNSGVVFSTSCPSTSWAQVISTDSIRRAIVYQTDPDLAASTVCLSTGPTNLNTCAESTPGVKVSTGATLTDYSGLNIYCRARSGTVWLTGYWTRDTGDLGAVSDPR